MIYDDIIMHHTWAEELMLQIYYTEQFESVLEMWKYRLQFEIA